MCVLSIAWTDGKNRIILLSVLTSTLIHRDRIVCEFAVFEIPKSQPQTVLEVKTHDISDVRKDYGWLFDKQVVLNPRRRLLPVPSMRNQSSVPSLGIPKRSYWALVTLGVPECAWV